MKLVSQGAEDVLVQLVAWELLGAEDVDPKRLLRTLPLPDLAIVQANINAQSDEVKQFVSVQMVELEMLYRRGFLSGDWSYKKESSCVHLNYPSTELSPLLLRNMLMA
jgi:hypothetical protein